MTDAQAEQRCGLARAEMALRKAETVEIHSGRQAACRVVEARNRELAIADHIKKTNFTLAKLEQHKKGVKRGQNRTLCSSVIKPPPEPMDYISDTSGFHRMRSLYMAAGKYTDKVNVSMKGCGPSHSLDKVGFQKNHLFQSAKSNRIKFIRNS